MVKGLAHTLKGGDKVPYTVQYLKAGFDLLETKLEVNNISEILDLDNLKKILIVNATHQVKSVGMKM